MLAAGIDRLRGWAKDRPLFWGWLVPEPKWPNPFEGVSLVVMTSFVKSGWCSADEAEQVRQLLLDYPVPPNATVGSALAILDQLLAQVRAGIPEKPIDAN